MDQKPRDKSAPPLYRPAPMGFIRNLIREDRLLAAIVLAMALGVKLFVPAGYMVGNAGGATTVTICSGIDSFISTTVTPATDDSRHSDGQKAAHAMPCAFTALAMATLAGADAPLLAPALAFILLVGILPLGEARIERPARIRPPSRAPPIFS